MDLVVRALMQLLFADHRLGARAVVGDAIALGLLGVDVGGVVERHVAPGDARLDRLELVRRDAERRGELVGIGLAAVALEPLPLAAQPIEAALLGARRPEAHHRPAAADVLLDVRANPPHRVGGEPHAAPGIEAIDRHQETEIALLDQIEQPHSVGAVLEGDLDDEAQVAGRQPLGRFVIAESGASAAPVAAPLRASANYIDRCGSGTR